MNVEDILYICTDLLPTKIIRNNTKKVFTITSAPRTIELMNQEEQFKKFESELTTFANQHSVVRLKISTINFDREYRRGVDGSFNLVSTKAIIRTLGHVTKVPIGDGCEFSTFEEAEKATKNYWAEYYKTIRANRSPEQVAAELKRQKRYRERRKNKDTQLKRQQ